MRGNVGSKGSTFSRRKVARFLDIFIRMLRGDFGGGTAPHVIATLFMPAIALACIAPKQAAAGDNFVPALFGGLALGTLFGIAAASPPPVYYAEPVYPPTCYWTRGRPVWDGYRGIWIRPRIQVCD
jgi:hypothetical protein